MVNKVVTPVVDFNVRATYKLDSKIIFVAKAKTPIGRTSGSVEMIGATERIEVTFYSPVNGYGSGWITNSPKYAMLTNPIKDTVTESVANDMLSRLIANNKEITLSLERVRRIVGVAIAQGKKIPDVEKKLLNYTTLSIRLRDRNKAIAESSLLSAKKTSEGILKEISNSMMKVDLNYKFGAYMGGFPVLIIAALAGVGLATAAYFAFKPKYDQSTIDLKISKDLEALLANVDKPTAERIKTDLEKQIDDAYNSGKTDGKFGGTWGTVKTLGLMFLGFFVVDKFLQSR